MEILYTPLVSIIIPVYNGSNYLKEAIESALNQTYSNIEILVINDGSNDNGETEKIAKMYGARIRYFSKKNGGVSSALNLGIEKMNGEWFSWLSHDDLYLPKKIENTIKIMNENMELVNIHKTIFSCKSGLIDETGNKITRVKNRMTGFYTGKQMFKNICKGNGVNGCSLLIPKEGLIEIGGFEDYRYIQDWTCWLNLSMKEYNFILFKDELVLTRIHRLQDTVRLSGIQPIETERYFIKLLNRLNEEEIQHSDFFKKCVLLYSATKINNKMIIKKYKESLISNSQFTYIDKSKYRLYLVKGFLIKFLKNTYRGFLMKRRENKI